jgi:hypothetical protein
VGQMPSDYRTTMRKPESNLVWIKQNRARARAR